ncbi:MAG TPA: xanthine dehydrogenase family protein molybdopterin-binding subunit, partial [Dehalococcoidia bacterium]|nr:xanthine dehydrogenase family protein molybdopterin-binding subunit [Dehalococcoidia bacterium]
QIYRRMRGEEVPADREADLKRLAALGLLPKGKGSSALRLSQVSTEPRAAGAGATEMRIAPGSVVGNPTIDIRARDKITGRAKYSSDVYLPGMLYTKVLRSPHPHARIRKLDITKAAAYPGVAAVITNEDVPKGPGIARPALSAEPAFAGEPIAAVAAASEAIAEEALRLIEVDYEVLPFVLGIQDALKPDAPKVRSTLQTNATRSPQFSYQRGDAARGMTEAEVTAEVEVQTSFEQHVAMEPHNAVAVWDRELLTIHAGNQWPHGIATAVAGALQIPTANIRVFAQDTGGGWGDKAGALAYHTITAVLAKKTGRPVRWELNRKDIFVDAGHNYPLTAKAKVGLKRDGTITALEGTSWIAGGAYGAPANTDDWESALRTYRIANVNVNGLASYTNTVVTSPLRSVGEASGVFFSETLFNRAAEAIDMDPLQFRLKNIETARDQVANLPYSSIALRECLETGARLFRWNERWKGWKKGARDLSKPQRGIGMTCFTCNKGANSAPMTAIVQIQGDGSIIVNTGAADIGSGQRTTWIMIVAEALGVPLDRVKINAMDNQAGPDALGIFGSRGTKSVGTGMLYAALDARRKLLQGVMARLNSAPPTGQNAGLRSVDELDIQDGIVFRKSDPGNQAFRMTVAQAAAAGVVIIDDIPRPASGTIVGEARVPSFTGYSQKTFGAGFYEVEVDPGTGFVKVIEAVQVHDVGRAINPTGLINQVHGGIMHGINKALTEEIEYDAPTGIIVNANLDEYKLHMIDSMPEKILVEYVEPYDVIGPWGAKGIGEPALLPPAASINAAIYDAIGVHIDHQPMTPVRILNAIKARPA